MQLNDVFCFIMLTTTLTASCVVSESQPQSLRKKVNKRIARDTSVILENYPSIHRVYKTLKAEPRAVYQKTKKSRNRKYRPKFAQPVHSYDSGSRYKHPKSIKNRKPLLNSIPYRTSSLKQMSNKRRKHITPKTRSPFVHGPENDGYYSQAKPFYSTGSGFGEPPELEENFHNLKDIEENYIRQHKPHMFLDADSSTGFQTHYKPTVNKNYVNLLRLPSAHKHEPLVENVKNDHDSKFAFTMDEVNYEKQPLNYDNFVSPLHSYADVYKYSHNLNTASDPGDVENNLHKYHGDEKVVVGGLYAEPPARYVSKFQPSASVFDGNDDFGPPRIFTSDGFLSANTSPYVNYKNSNLAFSPQNLNDAFSL